MNRRQSGFTLLELLVAIAVFAIIGVLATGGLNAVLDQSAIASDGLERLNRIQRSVRLISDDLYQLHPRTVRDELGRATEAPVIANDQNDFLIRFSRAGWRNPAGLPRSSIQRVQYRLEEGELIREYWPVLDRTLGLEPESTVLLDDVAEVDFEFLDYDNVWQQQWPSQDTEQSQWPKAVRIKIEIEGLGTLQRLIEVAG